MLRPSSVARQCERAWRVEMPGALRQNQFRQRLGSRQEARSILRPEAARSALGARHAGFQGLDCRHQLALGKTSSTTSGCFAITASNTRAGPSGLYRPCSQLRSVAGAKPNFSANCVWLNLSLRRIARTSTTGNRDAHRHVLSASPCEGLVEAPNDALAGRELCTSCRFVAVAPSLFHFHLLCSVRMSSGIRFLIAFLSAFVKLAFAFFGYISSIKIGICSLW